MKTLLLSLVCSFSLLQLTAQSQSPEEELQGLLKKYVGDSYVYTSKTEAIRIEQDGRKFDITSSTYEERMFLNDTKPPMWDQESVAYTSFDPVESIEAYALHPSKNKYRKEKVDKYTTKDELDDYIFYDDMKSINFTYPTVMKGGKTAMEVDRVINEPRFLGGFYFASGVPIEHASFSVTFPETVTLSYKCFNCDSIGLQFTQEVYRGDITYTWTAKDLPKIKFESGAPNFRYFIPHIQVFISKYKVGQREETLLEAPADLYKWYCTLTEKVNKRNDPAIQLLVDSLTNGATDDLEKVRRIYYWVEDHVKYIAIEAGLGGFIPREAELVYKRRYGDCKDMASLLVQMLRQAGLNGYMTWAGTRDIPYSIRTLPTPSVDNHMIATYISDEGKYFFLDATGSQLGLDLPSPNLQGKEVLIGKDRDNFEIHEIPTLNAFDNRVVDTINIEIKDGDVSGHGHAVAHGYKRFYLASRLRERKEKDTKNILSSYLEKGNNKFNLDNYEVTGTDSRDMPVNVQYDFTIADYTTQFKDNIYLNMYLEKPLYTDKIDDDRKVPLESTYHTLYHNVVILDVGDDYEITHIPANSTFNHDLFNYEFTYTRDGNRLILDQKVAESYLLLQPEHFQEYNEMIKQISEAYSEVVTLKKTNP